MQQKRLPLNIIIFLGLITIIGFGVFLPLETNSKKK